MLDTMHRAVSVDGQYVKFANAVGGFVGSDYVYQCATEEMAEKFSKFLQQRDPNNPKLPTAVTDQVRRQFKAKEIR